MVKKIYAGNLDSETFNVSETFGSLTSLGSIFNFFYNLFVYLGWAMVLIGIVASLTVAIFNIAKSDSSENFENVKSVITKLVLIIFTGLLLLSGAFILSFVGSLFGVDLELSIPDELFV